MGRRKEAAELLRNMPSAPDDVNASAGHLLSGRQAEADKDYSAARHVFTRESRNSTRIITTGSLARERLADARMVAAQHSPKGRLDGWALWRSPPRARRPIPSRRPLRVSAWSGPPAALVRFQDWAEAEPRYGARHDGLPHVIATELAKTAKVPTSACVG